MQDDRDLILKIQKGDQESYAEIVRRYQAPVIQLCRSMTADLHETEDLAQEIFVKAFYALNSFKAQSAFYTWLYRIAVNHCRDRLRKKKRMPEESWEALVEKRGPEIENLLSSQVPQTDQSQNQELISQVLSSLPEQYREILTLREVQDLSYEEMGQVLKCSLDGVKGRLKRAREDFRQKLRHFLKIEASNKTGDVHGLR